MHEEVYTCKSPDALRQVLLNVSCNIYVYACPAACEIKIDTTIQV